MVPLSLVSEIKLSGVTGVLDDLIRFALPGDVWAEYNEKYSGIKSPITILPYLNININMSSDPSIIRDNFMTKNTG